MYDPACGSAGLLIKTRLVFKQNHSDDHLEPKLFGQELNPTTFAMAKMNAFLHDFEDAQFAIGDTFPNPGFNPWASANGKASLRRFDYVVANPMWNQDNYDDAFYDNDPYDRFTYGNPPRSSADWGWAQHILASLHFIKRKPKNVLSDEGIAAVVDAYRAWESRPKLSRIVTVDELRVADYNLSPSQFVEVADRIEHRPLPAILADLAAARAERERADAALERVLTNLGLLELDVAASAKM